jgi:hypothetical protein
MGPAASHEVFALISHDYLHSAGVLAIIRNDHFLSRNERNDPGSFLSRNDRTGRCGLAVTIGQAGPGEFDCVEGRSNLALQCLLS